MAIALLPIAHFSAPLRDDFCGGPCANHNKRFCPLIFYSVGNRGYHCVVI